MAFVSDSSPDQQNQNQTPGQNPLSQQAPITSAPNASSAKGATGQPSNSSPAQPFTNLSSYLTANAPQIQAEGQQIAGGLNSQYGQLSGDINNTANKFVDNVNSSFTPQNQGVLDTFNSDPTKVASDPTQAATFKGMYNDSYAGPANFETTPEYLGLSGQVQSAVSNAQNIQTPQGVAGYFSSTSPTYTQGMGNLDASLLQANPDVVSTIKSAATPFSNLPTQLTSAVNTGDAAAQNAVKQAQAAKAAAQGAFSTQSNAFNDSLQNELKTATTGATDFNNNFNGIIAALSNSMPVGMDNGIKQLTDAQQAAIGVNQSALDKYTEANQILDFYGHAPGPVNQDLSGMGAPVPMSMASYLHGGNIASLPTGLASVASASDYAKANALASLGGDTYTSPLNPADAGKAGTYQPGGNYQTFDQTGANSLIDQVNARDQALADNYFSTTGGDLKRGSDADALARIINDPASFQPGTGASYMLSAFNRLINGFSAPTPGYTPPTDTFPPLAPPILGGGTQTGSGQHTPGI